MVDLWRDFRIRETGTGQQVDQLHDRYMMMMIIFSSKIVPLWDNVENYCRAVQDTDDSMAHAHCMPDPKGYTQYYSKGCTNTPQCYIACHLVKHLSIRSVVYQTNVDSFEPFIKVVFEFLLFSVYTRCLYRQTLQISTTFCSLFVWNMKTQLVSFHQYTHALGSCNKIMFK